MSSARIAPTKEQIITLLKYYRSGKVIEAEKMAISITQDFPKNQFGWLMLGVIFMRSGRDLEALNANQIATSLPPENATAYSNLGVTLKKLGSLNEAEKMFSKAIAVNPGYPEAHNNLGNTFMALGKLARAKESYETAIRLNPDFAQAHNNLGNTFMALGKLERAKESYETTIRLNPDFAQAHNNLGNSFKALGNLLQAEESLKQAIALNPKYTEAYGNLGLLQWRMGKSNEAKTNLKRAIELKPNYPEAKHILSSLLGQTTVTAPQEFVERVFDKYAATFEHYLVDKLDYKIPKVIAKKIIKDRKSDLLGSVLDLGCGTGLLGIEIKKFCVHLEGIDLSSKMLDKARKKKVYDKLIKQDILTYLSNEVLNFDYFISTDVFIYIGDLFEVFRLIKSRNKKGGKLVFSTEDNDTDNFFLEQSGRYSHSKSYVESLCETFGYKLRHFETQNLRKEKNLYIKGGLYILDF